MTDKTFYITPDQADRLKYLLKHLMDGLLGVKEKLIIVDEIKSIVSKIQEQEISPEEELLSLEQVMKMTQLSKTTLHSMRKKGIFPLPIKLGLRKVLWKRESIDKWIRECDSDNYADR